MPHSVDLDDTSAKSFDSLDTSTSTTSGSSLPQTDPFLQTEKLLHGRPRIDTLGPWDDLHRQRSCQGSQNTSNAMPPQPLRMQIELPSPSKIFGKKQVVAPLAPGMRLEHVHIHQRLRPNWGQRLCLHWLTAYRILISVTFAVNLVIFLVWIHTSFPLAGLLQATSANVFAAILVRQEDLINVTFSLVARTPASLPLWARRFITDFHHYGGLHIGCAVSALMWYCLFIAINTLSTMRNVNQGKMTGWLWADVVTCYSFLAFILFICITAHPRLRIRFHNSFERMHRFGGWAALLVLWVNAGIGTKSHTGDSPLYESASIWLLAGATFLIILPWLRIRRVPIQAEAVSSREVKLTFPYAAMPYTSTMRFSTSPLLEWHAFATIPSADGLTASILISQAGDWTKHIIQHPPQEIWLRKPPTANFLAFTPIFNSVLLVGTGAGIGPLLSLLTSPAIAQMKAQGKQVRVMWCVYNPDAPHWTFVQDIIRRVDPMPKIFDSRLGRPDVAFETRYMKHMCGIEAVMVVSNKTVTDSVVREIKAHGGAAYGAVFDS